MGAEDTAKWGQVSGRPTEFPPAPHAHAVSDVTGLQSGLDGKAGVNHSHTAAAVGAVARSGTAVTLWSGTQAQYDALATATKNAAGFIAIIA